MEKSVAKESVWNKKKWQTSWETFVSFGFYDVFVQNATFPPPLTF